MSVSKYFADRRNNTMNANHTEETTKKIQQLLDTAEVMQGNLNDHIDLRDSLASDLSRLERRGYASDDLEDAKDDLTKVKTDDAKKSLSALIDELNTALSTPNNVNESRLGNFRTRSSNLDADITRIGKRLQQIEDAVKALKTAAKANPPAPPAPQSPAPALPEPEIIPEPTSEEPTPEPATDAQAATMRKLMAQMWAQTMVTDYKAAGRPDLLDAKDRKIIFCLPIQRRDKLRYFQIDPATAAPEDLEDSVAGYMDKKTFVPYEDGTGEREKELLKLAYARQPWRAKGQQGNP